jgi:predicted amidophosphoribosyltransferase
MNYFDILKASKGKNKMPSMDKIRWNNNEKVRAENGLCIQCGENSSWEMSFLCQACEGAQSNEEIREEIALIRERILRGEVSD